MTLLRESDLLDNHKLVAESINQLESFANPEPVPNNPLKAIVPYQNLTIEYISRPIFQIGDRGWYNWTLPEGGVEVPESGMLWFWFEGQSYPSASGRESYITRITGYDVLPCAMLHARGPISTDEAVADYSGRCTLITGGVGDARRAYYRDDFHRRENIYKNKILVGVDSEGYLRFTFYRTNWLGGPSLRIGAWHLGGSS